MLKEGENDTVKEFLVIVDQGFFSLMPLYFHFFKMRKFVSAAVTREQHIPASRFHLLTNKLTSESVFGPVLMKTMMMMKMMPCRAGQQ